jgi:VCBS repeat protein/all-beta uncharacterized protein/S-layer family protein/BACON domain-containing protein
MKSVFYFGRHSAMRLPGALVLLGLLASIWFLVQSHPISHAQKTAGHAFDKATLSEQVNVRAAGRGNPLVNLSDGRAIITSFSGDQSLKQALETDSARPLSLASADFDEDGVADLVSGYGGPTTGIITVHRGNVDSIYPNAPEAKQRKAVGAFTDSPFLSPARVFEVAEAADFIGTGDFDGDSHWDVVAARRGGDKLHLLSGDGRGGFVEAKEIKLPGTVTALSTGEINRRDGLADVVVGVVAADGAKALVFEGPEGALRAAPEFFDLPAEAKALALGQLDDQYTMDLAVASGRELVIVHGRDRKLSLDQTEQATVSKASINRRGFASAIRSLALGDFTDDGRTDIALLMEGGAVQLLSRAEGKKQEVAWETEVLTAGHWPLATCLTGARVSGRPSDDLLVIDQAGHLHILVGETEKDAASRRSDSASLDIEGELVALLPMRLNADALSDLVMLNKDGSALSVAMTQPMSIFTVTNTNDSGSGSLRQAITDANANPGADTITFDIGMGAQTIIPASILPTITGPVTIDATTQPGFAGTPIIELNGATIANLFTDGLIISAGASTVRGLVINRYKGVGISIKTNGSNVIEGNYVGIDVLGNTDLGNNMGGVEIIGTTGNIIGGTTAEARNVCSGNGFDGVSFLGDENHLQGNYIGTNAAGTAALRNSTGVSVNGENNVIGGTTAGARNLLSGHDLGSTAVQIVLVESTGNLVQGNFIGTNPSGTSAVANSTGVQVWSATNNTIGGTTVAARNIVSGNGHLGISMLASGPGNLIQGNFIGTDVNGTATLNNSQTGITFISDAVGATVGGAVSGARNIISGNNGSGIAIGDPSEGLTTTNVVQGNFIGTDVTGLVSLSNLEDGINVPANAHGNRIENNRIAFNLRSGVCIPSGGAAGRRISIKSNSIYSNSVLGVDLGAAGVTANDPGDPDVGPNNLQNFPVLTSVTSTGGITHIVGSLSSTPNTDFFIQFFSGPQCAGSNPGQGQQVLTLPILYRTGPDNGNPHGVAPIDLTLTTTVTGWVNALARDPSGNTSEFSSCAQVNGGGGCSYSILPASASFPPNGGAGSVGVTAGTGCNWTAVSQDSFITITSGIDGTGNGTVNYQIAANTSGSTRLGTMTIAGQTFSLTQDGASPCTFSLNSGGQNFAAGSGVGIFNVTTQGGCNWTALPDVGWITTDNSGAGSGIVAYRVAENLSGQRTGHITVEDQVYTVTQDGAAVVCSYLVLPTSASIPIGGGSGSFDLTTQSGCSWNAAANVPWIDIPTGGLGSQTINYTVAANPGPARSGIIFVENQTFTINQSGGCVSISPVSRSFVAGGGSGEINITADAGCNWMAISNNPEFISITGGSSGTGNGTVSYSVAANSATTIRSGSVTISGLTFTVLQGAAFLDVPVGHLFYNEIGKLSARGVTVGCGGGNFCPDQFVTREQMAAFIIRAMGQFNPPVPDSQRFLDVPPSNPFYPFIERMAVHQITSGCGSGNYCPGASVTREQMAAFIIRGIGEFNPPTPGLQRYNDVPPGNPFYNFIDRMGALGITSGCSTSPPLYCPAATVTRGQMAVFLVRAFNL